MGNDFDLIRQFQGVREGFGAVPGYTQPTPPEPEIAEPSWGSAGAEDVGLGGGLKAYTQSEAARYGWTGQEWAMLDELVKRESGWNPKAQNPTSTAWGLGQFLDMHWGPGRYLPNGRNSSDSEQVAGMLRYIKERYGSPSSAIAHHNRKNWY